MNISRRSFCVSTAASLLSPNGLLKINQPETTYDMIAAQDRARIMRLAAQWLPAKPDTIVGHRSERSPGGSHDFFSEADYFWPNPANPTGLPYKEIDGRSNPDNFLDHRKAMIRLSQAVPALTAAYEMTSKPQYARAAIAHLVAWFVTPATRMNPNLRYSQGVRSGTPHTWGSKGRSYGIIDTLHLVEVARSVPFLLPVLTAQQYSTIQLWFSAYLEWMRSDDNGIKERDATNNHGICWGLQASEFARLTGNEAERDKIRERFKNIQLPEQMAANGSFPRELARTKPYGYSIFNFDMAAALCWSLADQIAPANKGPEFSPAAQHQLRNTDRAAYEESLGQYIRLTRPDGKGMCKAASFIYPYLKDKNAWPYAHDVQHWESWPVRSPGLLFCGLACDQQEYIDLWKKLDPDPTDPEVIRNFPIRQPLLWV